jgi:hypothetical protein
MKKARYVLAVFDNEIRPHEIPAFRGAVASKVGLNNDLFHNHDRSGKTINRYPAIQYKAIGKLPAIFAIGEGTDEIHKFFEQKDKTLEISGRELPMKLDRLDLRTHVFQVWNGFLTYRLDDWVALNGKNFQEYEKLQGMAARIRFLEKVLTANILAMAKGVDWHIEDPVKVTIKDIKKEGWVRLKGVKLKSFSLIFSCNVSLPSHIGLGKGAAFGFGKVFMLTKRKTNEEEK